jgi:hypothetical protein
MILLMVPQLSERSITYIRSMVHNRYYLGSNQYAFAKVSYSPAAFYAWSNDCIRLIYKKLVTVACRKPITYI